MPIRAQMEVALEATDAELFREIGKRAYLSRGELILRKKSGGPESVETSGRQVFAHLLPDITRVVCDQWGACEKLGEFTNEAAFGTAMAGALLAEKVAPTAFPIATIAVLTMRIGIKKLCKCG
jgi:hypothetical protein